MWIRRAGLIAALTLLGWAAHGAAGGAAAAAENAAPGTDEPRAVDEPPQKIGLVESARSRLAQLDITILGPREVLEQLTAEDLSIKVNLTKIERFQLDRICTPPRAADATTDAETAKTPALEISAAPRPTYLFFFDQTHLTMSGRIRALELAHELVRALVVDGSRATILSSAAGLQVVEPLTSDSRRLEQALDRLEEDRTQWDLFAEREAQRVDEVTEILGVDVERAIARARLHQRDEAWRADRSMRQLKVAIGQLVDLEPPKVVIYFSDRIRSNPGEHYLTFFGTSLLRSKVGLQILAAGGFSGALPFDAVINEAAAQGIRLYTIQAEGLVTDAMERRASYSATRVALSAPQSSRIRIADAQNALADLAAETGGHAFLNGVPGPAIAERLRSDSSCIFIASFDPSPFRQDAPMRVVVKPRRNDITLRVRGRMVFQSESARRTSQLLRAFSVPGATDNPFELQANLIPTGFRDGRYSALLQLSVPGLPLQSATWDLGVSVLDDQRVGEEISGRLILDSPGIPAILERELVFKPGSYELVSVAHEATTGLIASQRSGVDWPNPERGRAAVGPIALIQSADGAFSRSGDLRDSGFLAVGPGVSARRDLATALIGLVCRNRRNAASLVVERTLIGAVEVEFPAMPFDSDGERCAQVRDLIAPGSLEPGSYRYRMRVLDGERIVDEGLHRFEVVGN